MSAYTDIYDLVVPKDNLLRQINELIDFGFIYKELESNYSLDQGRSAIDPIRMFKYLLLKTVYKLSDVDVVERSRYDMSFKYFLGMAPEEDVINPSSLTKFRKLRLKNIDLLDLLISKTVEIAVEKKIIRSKAIIVDSTHTKARYNQKSVRQILDEQGKRLRKAIYEVDEDAKKHLPSKVNNGFVEDKIDYSKKLIETVQGNNLYNHYPKITEKLNVLIETLEDCNEYKSHSNDKDARVGHKTADTSFYGYKTHIAMSDERIITGAVVTSGEKNDGKYLKELVKKSEDAGIEINEILGDAAYSSKENIEFSKEKNIKLISKLHPCVSVGYRKKKDEFQFNKDAGMYVCKAGHLAIRKAPQKRITPASSHLETYYFDVEKCRVCSRKNGCYKDGAKRRTYSVRIRSDIHSEQLSFQKSDYFKERAKERYKIEAKNSELKHRHGYDVASSTGLIGMEMQGAVTMFTANLKRILKLI